MRRSMSLTITLVAALVACLVLITHSAHATGTKIKSIAASSIRNPIPAGKILASPANFNTLRAQAYAAGHTKIAPSAGNSVSPGSPLVPANTCWHCLPGSSECFDMCENAGAREGRWSGCPRCNGCYNPDIPEDVTLCAQDRCRDRGAFDSCIGNLNARAALQCVRLVQPSAVLSCAGTRIGLGAAKVVPCYLWHCVPWS